MVFRRQRALLMLGCAAMAVSVALGCGSNPPPLNEILVTSSGLSGMRTSRSTELRAHLLEMEADASLPKDLNRPPIDPHANAVTGLLRVFPNDEGFAEKSDLILETLNSLDETSLTSWYGNARRLVSDNASLLKRVNEMSDRKSCNFLVDFERGYFHDMHAVYAAATACRLQLVAAALATESNSLDESIQQLERAWRWTDWLAQEATVESQLQAAHLRQDVCWVLQIIATDSRSTAADQRRLARLFARSLKNWPTEQRMLLGERALAAHAYELVRQGLFETVVTFDERKALREEGAYEMLRKADEDYVDFDQLRYMVYMKQVIALASRPYHDRAAELRELDRQLASSNEDRYAWLANRIFADGLTKAQADIARSKAITRGWWLALSTASGENIEQTYVSPFNGKTFQAQQAGARIVVELDDPSSFDPTVRLPDSDANSRPN